MRRLRNKLGDDPEQPRYIHTIRGTGYRFAPPR
ncbi:MAG: helix-turn-helix domain-containing protein [Chloroflexota bacterium]|nr:helix-turn-helix domain-containing protein [Chloroflexota bacterium]